VNSIGRLGAWLREHAGCDAGGWAIALDGKDLRDSWSDDGRRVLFSAMTHRTERQDAVVLGQITIPEGTTETTQVRTLLGELDIAGALVTADAAHTCADTARYLAGDCQADYLLTIKGNRDLRAGKRRVQSHRAAASHPCPRAGPHRAMAAGGAGGDRDPDRHPGGHGSSRSLPSPSGPWQAPPVLAGAAVVSWVGTRGVVPLAAALSVALTTTGGGALPQRDLVLVLAAAVIVVSLIVQGFTLEPLARFAGFGQATAADPLHEETVARLRLAKAGLARLDELAESSAASDAMIDRLRTGLQARIGNTRARLDRAPDTEPGP
jgi:hypothetical protein